MSFTRLDLESRLANFFPNNQYYQQFDFQDSIQDGSDELCAFTGCVMDSATIPFTAGVTYYDMLTLIPNYIGVIAIFNSVYKRWMFPTSLRKLAQVRWDWETAFGPPYWFAPVSHRYIAIFMKPGQPGYGNMQVFYRASGPNPLQDTTPIPIPDDHIQSIEEYCITDLLEQEQEWTKASKYFQSYQENCEKLKIYIQSRRNIGRQQRFMD